jgi:hypothetical protein
MELWPNFFIVGAPRAGTTSLYEYLKNIPQIYLSKIKEPHYFSKNINPNLLLSTPIRDKISYLKLFKNAKNATAIGDASPSYLWDPDAAKLIYEQCPSAKIIIILRNPIARSFSHYLMLVGHGKEKLSFREAINKAKKIESQDYSGRILQAGLYYEQVKRYRDIFGNKQVKILVFENFFNSSDSLNEIINFLGIKTSDIKNPGTVYNEFTIPRGKISKILLGSNKIRKIGKKMIPASFGQSIVLEFLGKKSAKPEIKENDKKLLEEFYRSDVLKLEELLGQKMPWKEFE